MALLLRRTPTTFLQRRKSSACFLLFGKQESSSHFGFRNFQKQVVSYSEEEKAQVRSVLQGRTTELPFSLNALQVLSKRYLLRDHDGNLQENPEGMFHRVARSLAEVEGSRYGATPEKVEEWANQFYSIMSNFEFTPAGRTLANAGGPNKLVSNCIVLHIEDSMESIFGTLKDAALLQKAGSGLGFPFHLLRPAGSATKQSLGTSSGPVSFLQVYNSAFGVIRQQNRHGANMAVMSVDHPDILEFIHCKDKEGDLSNFNVSVGLTDEFMRAVESKESRPWMCKFNGKSYKPRKVYRDAHGAFQKAEDVDITAPQLFDHIVNSAWKTGEPGCVFLDTVNHKNPLPGLGRIEACNPCGEQFLHDGDVCNLGSINLEKFVKCNSAGEPEVDYEKLRHVTRVAVRMLDNVIDLTDFPSERVNTSFRANRRVGLGIMGFADMLYQLNVGYGTEEGRHVARSVMKCVQESGTKYSEELASAKGLFPNWPLSVFAKDNVPRRNAAITNVPPTGSIAMMYDVSGGVEPYFALAYYYKGILGGTQLSYVNKHLRKALQKKGIFSERLMDKIVHEGTLQNIPEIPDSIKKVFVTSMDISAEDHILMQAAFQESCDNAISKTINFPNQASRNDILRAYILAWKSGCKGCTVYRDGSRILQVLNLNKEAEEKGEIHLEASASGATLTGAPSLRLDSTFATPASSSPSVVSMEENSRSMIKKGICPECKSKLSFSEGCSSCSKCGLSVCAI
eukprot:TRINITY_DN6338_c0_g1_i1.p1 TRINITY_DN6338_c0_g1~~TRINITY_DN6338_c0_g1_i1.p1  ORF type:complete len:738 (-),score=153.15 TRINITY_DN6338_c0_g1_i1:80-2293(-)